MTLRVHISTAIWDMFQERERASVKRLPLHVNAFASILQPHEYSDDGKEYLHFIAKLTSGGYNPALPP